jgi:hypothetical protein
VGGAFGHRERGVEGRRDDATGRDEVLQLVQPSMGRRNEPGDRTASRGDLQRLAPFDPCQDAGGVLVQLTDGDAVHVDKVLLV